MKAVFLDVDGVLNTEAIRQQQGIYGLGENQIRYLRHIIAATKADLVLSSTWRLYPEAKRTLEAALATEGLFILSQTPARFSGSRHTEISMWLKERQQYNQYAILDDDPSAGYNHEDSFFLTNDHDGLTPEIATKVINWLNQTPAEAPVQDSLSPANKSTA